MIHLCCFKASKFAIIAYSGNGKWIHKQKHSPACLSMSVFLSHYEMWVRACLSQCFVRTAISEEHRAWDTASLNGSCGDDVYCAGCFLCFRPGILWLPQDSWGLGGSEICEILRVWPHLREGTRLVCRLLHFGDMSPPNLADASRGQLCLPGPGS